MNEKLKERNIAIKYFEDRINEGKNKLSNLIFQQNNIRDKIKNCEERINTYKLHIENLIKESHI